MLFQERAAAAALGINSHLKQALLFSGMRTFSTINFTLDNLA